LSEKEQVKLEEVIAFNRQHLKKGVIVRLRNGKVKGVVDTIKEDKVIVIFENVKTTAEIGNLQIIEDDKAKKPAPSNLKKGGVQ